jgi:3-oxoacid CoA-transferase subunit A
MRNKIVRSFSEAVRDIPDGATVMIGGFTGMDRPFNLIRALRDQGAKDLTIISNGPGGGPKTAAKLWGIKQYDDANILVENKQVRKFIVSFTTAGSPAEKAILTGEIEIEFVPQGTLAERIRAGGYGIGGFYVKTGIGTIVAEGKEIRTIDGEEYLFEKPIKADFALIRAYKADLAGNLVYRGNIRDFNAVMAPAAEVSIAEVEDIVELGGLDSESIVTPGLFIDRIIKISGAGR